MIGVVFLGVIAFLLLLIPVFLQARRQVQQRSQVDENKALYRQRRVEIELNDAGLEEDLKQSLLVELDREFLAANQQSETFSVGPSLKVKVLTSALLVVLLTSGSIAFYQQWGAGNEIEVVELLRQSQVRALEQQEQQQLLGGLERASINHPDQPEWQYYRGRLLFAEGRYGESSDVFKSILATLGEDSERNADRATTLTLYAQALFFAANQTASESIYGYLTTALELSPDLSQARGLAGIMAFELEFYADAVTHWRSLWSKMPVGAESEALADGIRKAAEKAGEQQQVVDISWLDRAQISVDVDLSAQAKSELPASTPVFVLAKAMDGTPVPLAVVRLTVSELPATITLSDAQSMAPGFQLSNYSQVSVVARASVSGNPVASSGDWEASSDSVATRQSPRLSLLIENQLP